MALNKKSLGPSILSLEKGTNEEVQKMELDKFAGVVNSSDGTTMICFTTKEIPNKYFWASTSLYNFLADNIENAEYDEDTLCYSFPNDKVFITHKGKVPLKNDKSKSANVWSIQFNTKTKRMCKNNAVKNC